MEDIKRLPVKAKKDIVDEKLGDIIKNVEVEDHMIRKSHESTRITEVDRIKKEIE